MRGTFSAGRAGQLLHAVQANGGDQEEVKTLSVTGMHGAQVAFDPVTIHICG